MRRRLKADNYIALLSHICHKRCRNYEEQRRVPKSRRRDLRPAILPIRIDRFETVSSSPIIYERVIPVLAGSPQFADHGKRDRGRGEA